MAHLQSTSTSTATAESGFLESSISRTRSLLRSHSKQTTALIQRRSLQVFSHKSSEPPSRTGRRLTQDIASSSTSITVGMLSPSSTKKSSSSRFSSIRPKRPKRSTILRAVPAATACATAPLSPLERDMATLPNQEILSSIGRISPSSDGQAPSHPSPQNNPLRTHTRSSSAAAFSQTHYAADHKFPDLKGIIGTYTHGKVEWGHRHKGSTSPGFRSYSAASTRRPRIQVVIPLPKEQRDRPLPTSPFFTSPSKSQFRSPSTDMPSMDEVSPPSASKKSLIRDSVVSPMNVIQQRPARSFHPAIDTQIPKPDLDLIGPNNLICISNSSSEESHGEDGSSVSSNCSSRTSVDENTPRKHETIIISHKRSASAVSSTKSPVLVQKSGAEANATQKSEDAGPETGPRVAPLTLPRSLPRRYAPHPPIQEDFEFKSTCQLPPSRRTVTMPAIVMSPAAIPAPLQRRPTINRKSSKRNSSHRRSLLVSPTMGVFNQAILLRVETKQTCQPVRSPTLSEAENELENELDQYLTSMTEDNPFKWDDVVGPMSSLSEDPNDDLYSMPPVLPPKSSKRDSALINPHFRMSKVPDNHIAFQLKRLRNSSKAKGLKLNIVDKSKRMTDDFILSPIPIPAKNINRAIPLSVAENVLLAILESLDSLDDLFAAAIVNKGFYQIYKQHELSLMKGALRKMSPPAWEHRELCYPGHDQHSEDDDIRMEYTPQVYLQYYTRDSYIIDALKGLISEKCQSFLRPEIFSALTRGDAVESARVDDAIWRIWNFCKIFGCGKGREEDIVAQMDWLKGGVLVHQKTCTFSILTTDALDMNDTLASAPECFAKGNEGGLTAEQLYDMMELWNCLGMLLQPFEGRTTQAREWGVYDNTDVRGGDIDGEEVMLDEWYYYLLTLGLSPIFDLAKPCHAKDSSAFILAKKRGWMNWSPPVFGGTRRNFLKEATSRVYEDKIAMIYAESSSREVQRQISKQRIQRHITELRQRKNSGERMQEDGPSQGRPVSEWGITRARPPLPPNANLISHIPTLRSAAPTSFLTQQLTSSVSEMPANEKPISPERPRSPPRRMVAQPLLPSPPPSTVPSVADRSSIFSSMPSIDEHPAFRTNPSEPIPEVPNLAQHPAFRQHLHRLETQTISPTSPPTRSPPSPPMLSRPAAPLRTTTFPTVSPLSSAKAPSSTQSSRSPVFTSPDCAAHPVFAQHPLQREIYATDAAENSADKAIFRIVEMGFTAEQARRALRQTDLGDGLSIDRAVNMLLREG